MENNPFKFSVSAEEAMSRLLDRDKSAYQSGPAAAAEAIDDINSLTVFYHEPTVHSDASLSVAYTFAAPGDYIGVVTAGHPTKNTIYSAVFPFTVGKSDYSRMLLFGLLILLLLPGYYFVRRQRALRR
jgi:hypothetical protein